MPSSCNHFECRCARAAELAQMGRTMEAIELHIRREPVTCRKQDLDSQPPRPVGPVGEE